MCPDSEQYKTVCKDAFAHIISKLDRIDMAIRGNGQPGIQNRLDRLDRAEAIRSRLLWLIAASTVTLAVGVLWKFVF